MGLSYRKSVKMGPIRVTASKSGISYSAGVKGARVTKRADGKVQTTLSSHGVQYTKTTSPAKRRAAAPAKAAVRTPPAAKPKPAAAAKPQRAVKAPPPAKPARAPKPARPPKPAAEPKPARSPKPLKLHGHRFAAPPSVPAPWAMPYTVKGKLATLTLHQGGIHIERTRAGMIGGNHSADIPWQALAAVDFLAPTFFRNGHIHFATFNDPRGLTFRGNSDPMTSSFKNPHVISFDWPKSQAYKQLRDLLTGAYAPPPPYQSPTWQHQQPPQQQPTRQAQQAWQPQQVRQQPQPEARQPQAAQQPPVWQPPVWPSGNRPQQDRSWG